MSQIKAKRHRYSELPFLPSFAYRQPMSVERCVDEIKNGLTSPIEGAQVRTTVTEDRAGHYIFLIRLLKQKGDKEQELCELNGELYQDGGTDYTIIKGRALPIPVESIWTTLLMAGTLFGSLAWFASNGIPYPILWLMFLYPTYLCRTLMRQIKRVTQ